MKSSYFRSLAVGFLLINNLKALPAVGQPIGPTPTRKLRQAAALPSTRRSTPPLYAINQSYPTAFSAGNLNAIIQPPARLAGLSTPGKPGPEISKRFPTTPSPTHPTRQDSLPLAQATRARSSSTGSARPAAAGAKAVAGGSGAPAPGPLRTTRRPEPGVPVRTGTPGLAPTNSTVLDSGTSTAQESINLLTAVDEPGVPASQLDETPLGGVPGFGAGTRTSRVAQIPIQEHNIVRSYYVELPYNKTVSIIFPTSIKSVDLGSRDIIADKASDVENVLKIKASKVGFNETNYSVITNDGKFYSFVANYNEQPAMLALNLAAGGRDPGGPVRVGGSVANREEFINGVDDKDGTIQFSGIRANQSEVVYNCDRVLRRRRTVRHLGVSQNAMDATVRGFYVKDNVMYVKLQLKNKSNINYDIDYLRLFVVDRTAGKRTTIQETEIVPFYVHNEGIRTVRGHQKIEQVLAFQKFTIPDNKRILVQINETNGGRALTFLLNNEDIMNSGTL